MRGAAGVVAVLLALAGAQAAFAAEPRPHSFALRSPDEGKNLPTVTALHAWGDHGQLPGAHAAMDGDVRCDLFLSPCLAEARCSFGDEGCVKARQLRGAYRGPAPPAAV